MSTPYTPVPTYHSTIDVTLDGDLADAAEFNPPYQQCADNAAFCRNVIDPLISGGTISPTGPIISFVCSIRIEGGDSLTVTGGAVVFGACEVHGAMFCDSTADVTGFLTCHAGASFAGDVVIDAGFGNGSLTVANTITANRGAEVGTVFHSLGPSFFDSNITVNGAATLSGSSTLGSTSADTITPNGSVISPILFTGNGRCTGPSIIPSDANHTGAGALSPKYRAIFAPTLTGDWTWEISSTGLVNDDYVFVRCDSSTHVLTFTMPGGLSVSMGSTGTKWFYAHCISGAYRMMANGTT